MSVGARPQTAQRPTGRVAPTLSALISSKKCFFIIIYVPQDSPVLTETESGSWRRIDSKYHNCFNSLKLDNNVWFFLEQNNVHVTENCIRITNHCRCWKMPMLFSQLKKISFEELIEDGIKF